MTEQRTDLEQLRGILQQFRGGTIKEAISEIGLEGLSTVAGASSEALEVLFSSSEVNSILEDLEIPEEFSQQIRQELEKQSQVTGHVSHIDVTENKKTKYVRSVDGDTITTVLFRFPPNAEEYEKTLDEAADKGRRVRVKYKSVTGENIIDGIRIFYPQAN